MSKRKDNDWQSTRAKLVIENGSYTLAQADISNRHEIAKVWVGAIFLESEVDGMHCIPDFKMSDKALRCYFVEYRGDVPFWKFFWSRPPEFGDDHIFKTERMKEDPPKKGERYFNDAVGEEQIRYNTTFTLLDTPFVHPGNPSFNCDQSFVYRQHFDGSTGAFLGGLNAISPEKVPRKWLQTLKSGEQPDVGNGTSFQASDLIVRPENTEIQNLIGDYDDGILCHFGNPFIDGSNIHREENWGKYLSFIDQLEPQQKGIDLGICVYVVSTALAKITNEPDHRDAYELAFEEAVYRIKCHVSYLAGVHSLELRPGLDGDLFGELVDGANIVFVKSGGEKAKSNLMDLGIDMVTWIGENILD
ncbi:hypothetical protein N9X39_06345 [Alphaproteobacteria bacterium]|nr:hypothetical protein [Alphaproteobacteria bacterium]